MTEKKKPGGMDMAAYEFYLPENFNYHSFGLKLIL